MRLRPRHTQGTVTPSPAATKLKKMQEGTRTPRSRRPVGVKEPRPGATASKMAPTANAFESEPAAVLSEETQKDHAAPAPLTSRASGDRETERTAPAGFPSLIGAAASPTSPTQREDRSIAMLPEGTMNEGPNAPDHVTLGSRWYRVYPSRGRGPKRQVSYNYDQPSTIEEPPLTPTSRQQSQEENNIRTWSPTFAAALSAGRRDNSTVATQPRLPAERAARNISDSPRRKDTTTSQRRRGRSLSKRQSTWIRGDKDAPGQPPSLSKGHSQHSKRSSLRGSTATKRHNTRGKSVPSPQERSQLRRGMTGGRHIEPFGLPEPPVCGANFSSHRDLLCGDVDMRRADSF
ncbi:hypothetical protein HPB47_015548 [Ixodes persulcatus]|uniref:Uncharacterized protein n=1 Tax=Ixodes persulcatus TaxID=34615 RepID=A0AC60QVT5_IXOPE|nr:hypothetical protein HPB47_015548 [Ixodes persulcatus]